MYYLISLSYGFDIWLRLTKNTSEGNILLFNCKMKTKILYIHSSKKEVKEEIVSELTGKEEISEMWNHYFTF